MSNLSELLAEIKEHVEDTGFRSSGLLASFFKQVFLNDIDADLNVSDMDSLFLYELTAEEAWTGFDQACLIHDTNNGGIRINEQSSHLAGLMSDNTDCNKIFYLSDIRYKSFITMFPERAAKIIDFIIDNKQHLLWGDHFTTTVSSLLTPERCLRIKPQNYSALVLLTDRYGPGLEKVMSQILKNAEEFFNSKPPGVSHGIVSESQLTSWFDMLPGACLLKLRRLHKYKGVNKIDFYHAILASKNPGMPDELKIDAILFFYELEHMPRSKQTRLLKSSGGGIYFSLGHPFSFPETLQGENLAKVLYELCHNCDKVEGLINLPSAEDVDAKLIEILLSKDTDIKWMYQNALDCRNKLETKTANGSDAQGLARLLLSFGDPKMIEVFVNKARSLDTQQAWDILVKAFRFYFNNDGPYASELGARELLRVLADVYEIKKILAAVNT